MDKRTILAMGLCLFIFLGWMWISQKIWPAPPPAPPKTPDAAVPAPKPTPEKPVVPPPVPAPDSVKTAEPPRYAEKPPFTLKSKFMDVTLTNMGAGVRARWRRLGQGGGDGQGRGQRDALQTRATSRARVGAGL